MSRNPWDNDRDLSLDLVASLLRRQFPSFDDPRPRFFGAGWDFEMFLVNETCLFRFPKRRDSVRRLELETAFLAEFAADAPLAVPAYNFHGQANELFPYPFAGYALIPGRPAMGYDLPAEMMADAGHRIGSFLRCLHALDSDWGRELGIDENDQYYTFTSYRQGAVKELEELRAGIGKDLLDAAHHFFREDAALPAEFRGRLRILHNDLGPEHILVNTADNSISGIIDWGDLAIGDPALDFAGLYMWQGAPLVTAALETYGDLSDDAMWQRIRYYACQAAVRMTWYGQQTDKQDYFNAGEKALRRILAA